VKEKSLDAFDYLIVAFQNIGNFYGKCEPLALQGCRLLLDGAAWGIGVSSATEKEVGHLGMLVT
jgi:hypothetical protein